TVRLEAIEVGELGQHSVDFYARAVIDREGSTGAQPDALADIVLRSYPRNVFGLAQATLGVEDALLGNRRCLELQQHVSGAAQRKCETSGNIDRHVVSTR